VVEIRKFMNVSVIIVKPELKGGFKEELCDCINQLKSKNLGNRVISTTLFLNVADNEEYVRFKEIACDSISGQLTGIASVNYICQPPANGDQIAFELQLINEHDFTLERVKHKDVIYVRAHKGDTLKGIFVSGLYCSYEEGVKGASEAVFTSMNEILTKEGLSFNHIVRQWNYIEQIVHVENTGEECKQHYQLFNDVRSEYYGLAEFNKGYPAATGIGCAAGGLTISFYALPESPDTEVTPVDNPFQKPAFLYPGQVLVGEYSDDCDEKTTPKFVRAKQVKNDSGHITFISGTAAIRKEKTVALDSMKEQLLITIENIESLISSDNLKRYGAGNALEEKIDYYRGYVKDTCCLEEITQKCEELLPGVPYLFLVSDICRKELLIEIEALAS